MTPRPRGGPTVEGALRAFLDTDLDLYSQGGEAWKNYGALGAKAANTPEGRCAPRRAFRSRRAALDRAAEEGAAGQRGRGHLLGLSLRHRRADAHARAHPDASTSFPPACANRTTSRRSRTAWPRSWRPAFSPSASVARPARAAEAASANASIDPVDHGLDDFGEPFRRLAVAARRAAAVHLEQGMQDHRAQDKRCRQQGPFLAGSAFQAFLQRRGELLFDPLAQDRRGLAAGRGAQDDQKIGGRAVFPRRRRPAGCARPVRRRFRLTVRQGSRRSLAGGQDLGQQVLLYCRSNDK